MSHAMGAVKFANGDIVFCEYNGTVDIMLPALWGTQAEMDAHWRSADWKECTDPDHRHEPVEIFSTYGNGFWWNGTACRECMALTDKLGSGVEDDLEDIDGYPGWSPWKSGPLLVEDGEK